MIFSVLIICPVEQLLTLEQRALDVLRPAYNVSPSANGSRGLKWSDQARGRLRAIRRAQMTPEVRAKIGKGVREALTAGGEVRA